MNASIQNFGRILFAIAFIGLGFLQVTNGEILAGRPMPWPESLPGMYPVALITGVLLIAAGVAIIVRKVQPLPLIAGLWILLWAASRNVFFIVTHLDYGFMMTNTGKSLTLGSGALLMAAIFWSDKRNEGSMLGKALKHSLTLSRVSAGLFLFASGVQHFLFAEFVQQLVPAWIPGALFWTYFAGVAMLAAGVSLLTGIKAQLAATLAGWMVFAWLLLLHIPRAAGPSNNLNEWTAVCEATAVSGLLLVMAYELKHSKNTR